MCAAPSPQTLTTQRKQIIRFDVRYKENLPLRHVVMTRLTHTIFSFIYAQQQRETALNHPYVVFINKILSPLYAYIRCFRFLPGGDGCDVDRGATKNISTRTKVNAFVLIEFHVLFWCVLLRRRGRRVTLNKNKYLYAFTHPPTTTLERQQIKLLYSDPCVYIRI